MCDCGKLIVISGPSGAGKSTVINRVMEENADMVFSVSVTTRAPREGETDGVNYSFVDSTRFEEMIKNDELLEYARYVDNFYGSPREAVFQNLRAGKNVVFDIEVQGAMQIKRKCPEAVFIFMIPSSFEEIERRLRSRGTDGEETIQRRLEAARRECRYAPDYKYLVFNDDPEVAAKEIGAIITAEGCRMDNRQNILTKVCSL
jgi:guanylate kinase